MSDTNADLIVYDLFERFNLFNRGCGYCNQSKLIEILSRCAIRMDIYIEMYKKTKLTEKELKDLCLKITFPTNSNNFKLFFEIDSKQIQINPNDFRIQMLNHHRLIEIYLESKLTELQLKECIKNAEKWISMIGVPQKDSFKGYIQDSNLVEKFTHITWPTLSALIGLIYLRKIYSFGIKEEQHFHSN